MHLSNICCILIFQNLLSITISLEIYESPNVKTALFVELDVWRSCWNHDEINLLRARMIMQDLIPGKVPRDLPYLVEYLRSTQEAVVLHSPEGKVRRIMMLALSDVLGGYLQAVAIPLAKEAYYAGNIDYATMSRLYDLLNEMKSRLRTDGGRWSRPLDMSQFAVRVTALHLPMQNSELACKAIFVIPAENCPPGTSRISIPYLDYDASPGAVALPLKARNLYSLKTAASSHIIVRFYILARQCLSEMPPKETENFNFHFIKWLVTKVVPHLYEDLWYPGFGSVMRIIETVNETEILHPVKPFYHSNDTSLEKSLLQNKECGIFARFLFMLKYNPWWVFLIAILLLFFLLFCCCSCVWFFYSYNKQNVYVQEKSSSGILNAVLSIYCGLKDKEAPKEEVIRSSAAVGYNKPTTGYQKLSYEPPMVRTSVQHPMPYPKTIGEEESSTVPSTSEDEVSSTTTT